MTKPLEGIKIIELSTYVAAPIAAKILGEWGAEVIKVEPLHGDEWRYIGATLKMPTEPECNPNYDMENVGKKSIALNLKTEEGIKVLHELLASADGIITNYRSEALEKLHLTYEEIHEKYPKIVFGQVVGYGLRGPDSNKAGFDLTAFFARSGLMIDPVEKDTKPMSTLVAVGDHATGISLAAGVCAALVKQFRTGEGEKVVSGLYQNSLYLSSSHIAAAGFGLEYPVSHATAVSPIVNSYQCKDGSWILIAGTSYDLYWDKMCRMVLQDEELANTEKYHGVRNMIQHREEMIKILDAKFLEEDRDEWERRLNAADIANEKILHWKDTITDEQALANEYIYTAKYENGVEANLVNTPVDFGSFGRDEFKRASMIGEDGAAILKDLGYAQEDIEKMQEAKVTK
ncbi:CoA transferase [Mollicutes bacterium LVI A0039]|nr:CoA transferase [Mollicutes bacterium LVI A0039]